MKTLTQLGDELHTAMEELQVAQRLAYMPALESVAGATISTAYRSAALEAEGEAKQSWFQRILAFFRRMYERVKGWMNDRKAKAQDKDKASKAQLYKEAVQKYRQDATSAAKEAETILNANMDNQRFKHIAELSNRGVDIAMKDASLFADIKLNTAGYNLYYGLYKDKSKAQEILTLMTKIGQYLDLACEFFAKGVEEARQARGQVRITVASLMENLQKAGEHLEQVNGLVEALQSTANAPKTVEDLMHAVLNFSFFNKLVDVPFIKDAHASVSEMLDGTEEMMDWFENVSNQNTRNSGNDLNDRVYDVGAQTLNTLALSPAKIISLVSKIEAVENRCSPNFNTGMFDSLQAAIVKGIITKIPAATPQEEAFRKEYLTNIIANKFTTYFVNSGL